MRPGIDREADASYPQLDNVKVIDSEQVAPGVIVDFDPSGSGFRAQPLGDFTPIMTALGFAVGR